MTRILVSLSNNDKLAKIDVLHGQEPRSKCKQSTPPKKKKPTQQQKTLKKQHKDKNKNH